MLKLAGLDELFAAAGTLYWLLMLAGVVVALIKGKTWTYKLGLAALVLGIFIGPLVPTLTAGGAGPGAGGHPATVLAQDIAALNLDYRMAVQLVSENSISASMVSGAIQALGSKSMLSPPEGNTVLHTQVSAIRASLSNKRHKLLLGLRCNGGTTKVIAAYANSTGAKGKFVFGQSCSRTTNHEGATV